MSLASDMYIRLVNGYLDVNTCPKCHNHLTMRNGLHCDNENETAIIFGVLITECANGHCNTVIFENKLNDKVHENELLAIVQ